MTPLFIMLKIENNITSPTIRLMTTFFVNPATIKLTNATGAITST